MARKEKLRRDKKRMRKAQKKTKLARAADGTTWRLALRLTSRGSQRWCYVAPHEPVGTALMVARRAAAGWVVDSLPPGAIRGDLRGQRTGRCTGHPAYMDYAFTCHRCGAADVFTAQAQKHWYETIGGHVDSGPVNCIDCRRLVRHGKRAHRLLAEALAAYDADPSPRNALSIAEVTAEASDAVGARARQRALGHARAALKAGLPAEALVAEQQESSDQGF